MKYYQPFGDANPNASYTNGNAGLGIRGSIPDARAIEHTQREILAVIAWAGLTPAEGTLTQLRDAIVAKMNAQLDTDGTMAANSDTVAASQKATRTYVAARIAALVNASPAALDTLNELAAALGNDANYAASVTTALGLKLNSSAVNAFMLTALGAANAAAAQAAIGVRERLTANRTYYVRTDGNDVNTGLANNAGGAWLTLQKAYDFVQKNIDLGGYSVTIQVGAGTYTAGVNASYPLTGTGLLQFLGDITTPANVLVSVTGGTCFTADAGAVFALGGFKTVSITTGAHVLARGANSHIMINGKMDFGACPAGYAHINAWPMGAITITAAYTISGSAGYHWQGRVNGTIRAAGITITTSGTPAFSSQFAYSTEGAVLSVGSNTFNGTGATGARYLANGNAVIDSGGGGATYLPGNSVGSIANGGQYI
jgi:hypothetical protein